MAANGSQPAHPMIEQSGDNYQNWITTAGLTKREYFAAMAMQGYIASYVGPELCKPADADIM